MLCETQLALRQKSVYESEAFARACPAENEPLGVRCEHNESRFRLWAPLALSVSLCLYPDGEEGSLLRRIPMQKTADGIWFYTEHRNLHGVFYLYEINHGDRIVMSGDPCARAVGLNSRRCMAVDLSRTNPDGWMADAPPARPAENIIYELHVKEFSWQKSAGFPAGYRDRKSVV